MNFDALLSTELEAHIAALQETVLTCGPTISEIVALMTACFERGNKALLCGNGGSAADAQHVAAELVNRFRMHRPALPAIALTTDSSIMTAIGNDSSFDFIFSRQVEALARPGDIVVGISTSGASRNILTALEAARAHGAATIGFTGAGGSGAMSSRCDICLAVPSAVTARIQEVHGFAWHVICDAVEGALFGERGHE